MDFRADRYAGAGVLVSSFAVYLLTVAPNVTFWDSGELIYGAVSLGIPHPPAYPIFCILGKALYFLPLGNAAYRINLLSALFGSLSSYMVFRLVYEMGRPGPARVPLSAAAALVLAFSGPLWSQAVVAEVYTINTVLLASLSYLLFRHNSKGEQAYLHASAFSLGLAFANHQSAVFLVPAYVVYYLFAGGVRKNPKRPVMSLFFMVFGYSAMLYLPVRASAVPMINIGDPDTLYWFKWAVKFKEHAKMFKAVPAKLGVLFGGGEALLIVAALAAFVALSLMLRKRPYMLFLIFAGASYFAGMKILTAGFKDIVKWGLLEKFFIPSELFAILTAAAVFYRLLDAAAPKGKKPLGRTAAYALAAWALLALPACALYLNWHDSDNSKNFFAVDFSTNTLKSVEQDGALFAWGDNGVFPVWYMQGVERYRQDVLFIHTELLTYAWYLYDVRLRVYAKYGVDFIPPAKLTRLEANVPILKLVLEKKTQTYFDYSAAGKLGIELTKLKPQGLIHLVSSWNAVRIGRIWDRYVLRGAFDGTTNKAFAAEGILDIYGYEAGIWAQQAYAEGRLEEALNAYELMGKLGIRNKYLDIWAEQIRSKLKEIRKQ